MERYSEYKDSGVQWLGEIPEHWNRVRLGKLSTIKTGTTPKFYENELNKNTIDWYTPSDFSEEFFLPNSQRRLNKEDFDNCGLTYFPIHSVLIIGIGGTAGKVACNKKECYSNQQITSLIPNERINYLFMMLYIRSIKSVLLETAHFTTLPILNNTFLASITLPLPPLPEQHSIVTYLDSKCSKIDEWINKKQKEVELLGEAKQRIIADAVTRGLNPNVKMKKTGIAWLEEVPEHWEIERLASFFTSNIDINKDFEYKHAFQFKYGTLILKNENGDIGEYRDTYVKYSILKKGDIVINGLNLNYDFNSYRVACAPDDGIITSAYIVCRPKTSIDYMYFTYLFKAMDSMKLFHGMGTGIRLTLSFAELRKQTLPVPPLPEQQAIVSYITAKTTKIDSLMSAMNKEIEHLKEYKQRLISDVVTGQIKVC